MKAVEIIDMINDGNRQEERELTFLLAPIDRRLTVDIFNKGWFDYEAAVGRNSKNNYQPGARFRFGVNPNNLRPYVMNQEFCIDFEENSEFALEWLRQEVAKALWNYFHHHKDRVQAVVNPLGNVA
jgi:hypothetical protein